MKTVKLPKATRATSTSKSTKAAPDQIESSASKAKSINATYAGALFEGVEFDGEQVIVRPRIKLDYSELGHCVAAAIKHEWTITEVVKYCAEQGIDVSEWSNDDYKQ